MSNFVFYGDWLKNIEDLPVEIQDKIIADIVRYGVDVEMAHEDEMTISMAVNFTKRAIDVSKEKYQARIDFGKNVGKSKKDNDRRIYELAQNGYKSGEIANILGISKSSVDHSEGWRLRKGEFQL